jgi:hypothetical protein
MVADPVNCDGSFSLDTSLDYAAAQTPSGDRDTPQAADPGRDSERRTRTTSDTEGSSSIQDEGADGEALPNDLNDSESFAASGGSDAEMEMTRDIRDERFVEDINGQDAVCFYEAQENVRYINESNEVGVCFSISFSSGLKVDLIVGFCHPVSGGMFSYLALVYQHEMTFTVFSATAAGGPTMGHKKLRVRGR